MANCRPLAARLRMLLALAVVAVHCAQALAQDRGALLDGLTVDGSTIDDVYEIELAPPSRPDAEGLESQDTMSGFPAEHVPVPGTDTGCECEACRSGLGLGSRLGRGTFFGTRPPGRYLGRGGPLERESWLNRPLSIGWFGGAIFSEDPAPGIGGGTDFLTGARVGWDFDHYWGCDIRLAASSIGLQDQQFGQPLSNGDLFLCDVNWLYYPWGDAQWRPYLLLGFGVADYDVTPPNNGPRLHETMFALPFGMGLKYRVDQRMAFRFELLDNVSTGSGGLRDMHNVSLTGGVEFRLGGGSRQSYWPWDPSRGWW